MTYHNSLTFFKCWKCMRYCSKCRGWGVCVCCVCVVCVYICVYIYMYYSLNSGRVLFVIPSPPVGDEKMRCETVQWLAQSLRMTDLGIILAPESMLWVFPERFKNEIKQSFVCFIFYLNEYFLKLLSCFKMTRTCWPYLW